MSLMGKQRLDKFYNSIKFILLSVQVNIKHIVLDSSFSF